MITIVNVVLCVIILILGLVIFNKKKSMLGLLVGVAFGLFGISHLMTVFDFGDYYQSLIVLIRVIAYILIIVAMW